MGWKQKILQNKAHYRPKNGPKIQSIFETNFHLCQANLESKKLRSDLKIEVVLKRKRKKNHYFDSTRLEGNQGIVLEPNFPFFSTKDLMNLLSKPVGVLWKQI